MDRIKLIIDIFLTFFKIGSISFGGGYAMIPVIEREIVEKKKWIGKEKIVDIFAVCGALPGAIALNSSAFAGYSVAGIPGAAAALIGNLLPSVFIVITLTVFLSRFSTSPAVKAAFTGIYPAIIALIFYAACKIGKTAIKDIKSVIIMILAFISTTFFHLPFIPVIITGAAAGIFLMYMIPVLKKRLKEKNSGKRESE